MPEADVDDLFLVTSSGMSVSITHKGFRIRAVAEATAFYDTPGSWYLNRVLVQDQKQRGQGLGSRMVRRLQEALVQQGCTRLIVEPGGYGSNIRDLFRFYRKLGFRAMRGTPEPSCGRPRCR